MADFEINVRTNVKEIGKTLDYFAFTQLPFATALALNSMADGIKRMETANFKNTFDKPTPFTMNAIGIVPATKNKPEAMIFVKDIQARYLEPYEFNGKQIAARPGNVAMLTPKGININQYGNIPQNRIKALLGLDLNDPTKVKAMSARRKSNLQKNQKMYFIGTVNRKGGPVSGLWQRLPGHAGLKLMVRFSDPQSVKEHLDYRKRAGDYVDKNFDRVLLLAVQHAMNTSVNRP